MILFFISKKRESIKDQDGMDKQWTEMDTETTKRDDNELTKKLNDDKSSSSSSSTITANIPGDDGQNKINPVKWTVRELLLCFLIVRLMIFFTFDQVAEVSEFIRSLPGCADYAEDFAIQEIDGQALLLLKEDHLMSAMNIKLGPALKIVARIDSMRIESTSNPNPTSDNS